MTTAQQQKFEFVENFEEHLAFSTPRQQE